LQDLSSEKSISIMKIWHICTFALLSLVVIASGCTQQTKIPTAGPNDITLGPLDWFITFSPQNTNYPAGVEDLRVPYIKITCAASPPAPLSQQSAMEIEAFIDGKNVTPYGYQTLSCPSSDQALQVNTPLDTSITHIVKVCWGWTMQEVDGGSRCTTITIPPLGCKRYNEACTVRPAPSVSSANPTLYTSDCCGNSEGSFMQCATPITNVAGQTYFELVSSPGNGVCKRVVMVNGIPQQLQ
jgi:hypothetical protein